MPIVLNALGIGLMAYLIGSIPFAIIVARLAAGIDVRTVGSGHAGATNTMRAAGWGAGVLVLVLDLGKGALIMALTLRFAATPWVWPVAAALGVAGHCWPVWVGFRGGMGMAVGGGMLMLMWPLGFVIGLGVVLAFQLIIHHSARANFATGLMLGPMWLLFAWLVVQLNPACFSKVVSLEPGQSVLLASAPLLATAAAVGLMIAIRSLADWKRVYKELWLDREG
ncbi:MAG TPA: glycerol-3-phosphate acyltransferase [Anaerolineae bacterium]|nr:glycerol-3-phosphate acyltransferase [Anaerolineae bacterium]